MATYEDFTTLDIRIGKILSAEKIEKSHKLLLLSVSFGEEDLRTVVSGIAEFFEDPQELVGVLAAFVTNLEPRSLMGHESQAMILGSKTEHGFSLLIPSREALAGDKIG